MPSELSITADPERLDEGSAEERACFGALHIQYGSISLTEGQDGFVNKVRSAPLLSAYHLAEWMAWNWWRLRWEPRSNAPDWQFAHRLTTIGEGYIWPNITTFSDGERIALVARPTRERPDTPFRYISDRAAVVRAREFEYVVDQFIEQIRGLLRAEEISESNLDRIWNDLGEERTNPETAKRRKLEALLGCDPDKANQSAIERLVEDAQTLGQPAMNEIAADNAQGGELMTADTLRAMAESCGFDALPEDVVRLTPGSGLPRAGDVPAWQLGAAAAKALREQERRGVEPIGNEILARLAGAQTRALTERVPGPKISFALDTGAAKSRVVLRSNGRQADASSWRG